jgi:NADH:ubiquinone reductase (H+-translocating)
MLPNTSRPAPSRPSKVLVLGGGAGGLELAIRLARLTRPGNRAEVTLVDRRPTHIWKPRLHEIGAGLLVAAQEETGYAAQGLAHGFDFVLGEAVGLDPVRQQARLAATPYPPDVAPATPPAGGGEGGPGTAPMLPARTLPYDVAVLALGSRVDDFGIPGVFEHCHTLDSPSAAERLHRALLVRAAQVKAGVLEKVRVAIVGAGATGVELAAELRNAAGRLAQYRSLIAPGQLAITLMERADRALPGSPPALSSYARTMLEAHAIELRFGAEVVGVQPGAVELTGGERVEAERMVWASGVKANALAEPPPGIRLGPSGRLAVDQHLRLLKADGAVLEGLYAIGDCAAAPIEGEGVVGATAQAAHQQAGLLARSIARQLRGRPPLPFRFRYKGALVSLGEATAVGDLPTPIPGDGLRVSGIGAKLAYTGLYEAHLAELNGWWRTAALAASSALRRSAQPTIKLFW